MLDPCLGLAPNMVTRPKTFGPDIVVRLKDLRLAWYLDSSSLGLMCLSDLSKQQTNKGQLCTLVVRREKKEKHNQSITAQQSNHDMSTRATPCGRGHVCASSYMAND